MSVIILAIRSGMQTWRNSPASDRETEVKLMDADTLPVLVTKYFPHELLIGSDAISRGNGKIDYGTRKVTSFGQNFCITPYTDFIPHTASV